MRAPLDWLLWKILWEVYIQQWTLTEMMILHITLPTLLFNKIYPVLKRPPGYDYKSPYSLKSVQ